MIDWSGKAFKKMRNLKILIIRNAQFSTGPRHLPNSLRVLDWKGYPCPSLPSEFKPKELIILKMPESSLKRDVLLKSCRVLAISVIILFYNEARKLPNLSQAMMLSIVFCFLMFLQFIKA